MNKQDECFIIKDLAASYIENMTSPVTTQFIKRHLLTCENCNKYYNDMKSDIFKENIDEHTKENIEVNHLKKINHHMNKLKIIILFILLVIIIPFSVFYINTNKVNTIINKSYNQISQMKKENNYIFTHKTIRKNNHNSYEVESVCYYKDGKYKIEFDNSITFAEDNSYNEIVVHNDLNTIEYHKYNFIQYTQGNPFNTFTEIINYKKHGFTIFDINITEDSYNGIKCYIINIGNENDYKQIWIDKENYFIVRKIEENKGAYYYEETYNLEKGIVKNEDVDASILNTEKYTNYTKKDIEKNYPGELVSLYELHN